MAHVTYNSAKQTVDFGGNGMLPETLSALMGKHGLDTMDIQFVYAENAPQAVVTGMQIASDRPEANQVHALRRFSEDLDQIITRGREMSNRGQQQAGIGA